LLSCRSGKIYPRLDLEKMKSEKLVLNNNIPVFLNKHNLFSGYTAVTVRITLPAYGSYPAAALPVLAENCLINKDAHKNHKLLDIEYKAGVKLVSASGNRYIFLSLLVPAKGLVQTMVWLKEHFAYLRNISSRAVDRQRKSLTTGLSSLEYLYNKAARQAFGSRAYITHTAALQNIKLPEIKKWIQDLFYADNMSLFISGNIKKAALARVLNNSLALIPANPQGSRLYQASADNASVKKHKTRLHTVYLENMLEYNNMALCRIKLNAAGRALVAFREKMDSPSLYKKQDDNYIYLLLDSSAAAYFKKLTRLNKSAFTRVQGEILNEVKEHYNDPLQKGLTFFKSYYPEQFNFYNFIRNLDKSDLLKLKNDILWEEHKINIRISSQDEPVAAAETRLLNIQGLKVSGHNREPAFDEMFFFCPHPPI